MAIEGEGRRRTNLLVRRDSFLDLRRRPDDERFDPPRALMASPVRSRYLALRRMPPEKAAANDAIAGCRRNRGDPQLGKSGYRGQARSRRSNVFNGGFGDRPISVVLPVEAGLLLCSLPRALCPLPDGDIPVVPHTALVARLSEHPRRRGLINGRLGASAGVQVVLEVGGCPACTQSYTDERKDGRGDDSGSDERC